MKNGIASKNISVKRIPGKTNRMAFRFRCGRAFLASQSARRSKGDFTAAPVRQGWRTVFVRATMARTKTARETPAPEEEVRSRQENSTIVETEPAIMIVLQD